MKLSVDIKKRYAYVIIGLFILVAGVFVVGAFTNPTTGVGHVIGDVNFDTTAACSNICTDANTKCDTSNTCSQVCIGTSCQSSWPSGADGYNADNAPTATGRGEPTKNEIVSWGADGYAANTDDQTCAEVSGCVANAAAGNHEHYIVNKYTDSIKDNYQKDFSCGGNPYLEIRPVACSINAGDVASGAHSWSWPGNNCRVHTTDCYGSTCDGVVVYVKCRYRDDIFDTQSWSSTAP